MSNVTDQFVPTGVYSLTNVASGKRLSLPQGQDSLQGGPASNDFSDKWIVILLVNKKFYIRNGRSGLYAYPESDYGEGDPIYAQRDNYEWVIKAVRGSPGQYQIYSRIDSNLFWSQSDCSPVEFSRDASSNSTRWTFTKEEDIPIFGALPTVIDGVTRPVEKVQNNNFEVTVPKGWTAVVSGVPLGRAINSVHLQSVDASKLVEMIQFYNKHDDGKLTLRNSAQTAHQISADAGPVAIGLAFYCTADAQKKDPLVLAYTAEYNATLNVTIVDRSIDLKRFPDYRIYHIISWSPSSNVSCAVVTVTLSKKETESTKPTKPEPGTVNPGYNPECDDDRPQYLDEYLRKYDSSFLVDDSGSMAGPRWDEARKALIDISNEALQYDADGISLQFLNSQRRENTIRGQNMVLGIFDTVTACGSTPTGARLDAILAEYISKLDNAIGTPLYGQIKPLDLICLTDGEPTDAPLPILEKWAAHLDAKKHHPNIVGVQFVQIGNAPGCDVALLALTKGNVRGMVDTVPYNGPVTPERLTRILLGAIKPSVRKHANAHLP